MSSMPLVRSSSEPRSESRTDTMLLRAAVDLFGRHGYDRVTTRMLADGAATNVSSIRYHFRSKDGLYIAVIDEIVRNMGPRIELLQQIAGHGLELAGHDPARLAAVVRQVIQAAVSAFLENPELRTYLPFVLREIARPGPHFDRLYDALPRRLHETATRLVAHVQGRDEDEPRTIIRAHALVGQLIVFQIGRPILCRRLAIDDYTTREIAVIRDEVVDFTLGALGLPREHSHV